MANIEGGCLCGAVRYRAEGEPAMQVICHCKTCQKNSGSAYSLNVAVPEEAFTAEGDSKSVYEDHSGASGKPFYRTYCGKCGSHVFSNGPAYGAMVFIKAGTLDESGWLQPDTHIWCDEKLPYVQISAEAKQFPRGPA